MEWFSIGLPAVYSISSASQFTSLQSVVSVGCHESHYIVNKRGRTQFCPPPVGYVDLFLFLGMYLGNLRWGLSSSQGPSAGCVRFWLIGFARLSCVLVGMLFGFSFSQLQEFKNCFFLFACYFVFKQYRKVKVKRKITLNGVVKHRSLKTEL